MQILALDTLAAIAKTTFSAYKQTSVLLLGLARSHPCGRGRFPDSASPPLSPIPCLISFLFFSSFPFRIFSFHGRLSSPAYRIRHSAGSAETHRLPDGTCGHVHPPTYLRVGTRKLTSFSGGQQTQTLSLFGGIRTVPSYNIPLLFFGLYAYQHHDSSEPLQQVLIVSAPSICVKKTWVIYINTDRTVSSVCGVYSVQHPA